MGGVLAAQPSPRETYATARVTVPYCGLACSAPSTATVRSTVET